VLERCDGTALAATADESMKKKKNYQKVRATKS
jgi:hypothetical protein